MKIKASVKKSPPLRVKGVLKKLEFGGNVSDFVSDWIEKNKIKFGDDDYTNLINSYMMLQDSVNDLYGYISKLKEYNGKYYHEMHYPVD